MSCYVYQLENEELELCEDKHQSKEGHALDSCYELNMEK
jgi:hypothetical protein